MDVEWSTVVKLEHPWYQGVKLYTISRGVAHNSESQQRYLNCRDLENFIQESYEEEEESVTEVIAQEMSVVLWEKRQIKLNTLCDESLFMIRREKKIPFARQMCASREMVKYLAHIPGIPHLSYTINAQAQRCAAVLFLYFLFFIFSFLI